MPEYLKEEQQILKKMEDAGFTEKQIDAIYSWIEFAKNGVSDYLENVKIHDAKVELKRDIRKHRHQETGEVYQPY